MGGETISGIAMRTHQFRKWDKQRRQAGVSYDLERISHRADLQSMLAEAAKNTAEDQKIEEFIRVVGPLLKGKRH